MAKDKTLPQDGYKVGYKKPPREHQFKKGHSGNRKGRPKGVRNISVLIMQNLDEKILITENGKPRKMTMREAIARRVVIDAAKGNGKAREIVFAHSRDHVKDPKLLTTEEWFDQYLDERSSEELEALLNQLIALGAGPKQPPSKS